MKIIIFAAVKIVMYCLTEAVLTSTHDLYLGKIRNNTNACKPHFYYIKVGCKGYNIRTFYPDVQHWSGQYYNFFQDVSFLFIFRCISGLPLKQRPSRKGNTLDVKMLKVIDA